MEEDKNLLKLFETEAQIMIKYEREHGPLNINELNKLNHSEHHYIYFDLIDIRKKIDDYWKIHENELIQPIQPVQSGKQFFTVDEFFDYIISKPYRITYDDKEIYKRIKTRSTTNLFRNVEIMHEVNRKVSLKYLAKKYGISSPAISKIAKSTLKKFCEAKGHLFEIDFSTDLKNSKIFGKVIHEGTKGRPDIHCTNDITMKIFVFSCKCLHIDKKKKTIIVEDLQPEIIYAKDIYFDFHRDYEVIMYVIILDNVSNILHIIKYDYGKPEDVVINY